MSTFLIPLFGGAMLLIAAPGPARHRASLAFTLIVLAASLVFQSGVLEIQPTPGALAQWLINDNLTTAAAWLACGLGILLAFVLSPDEPDSDSTANPLVLLLFSLAGLMLAAAADDLIVVFAAVELVCCCVVFAGLSNRAEPLRRATVVQAVAPHLVSSLLFLFGLMLIYGLTASTNLTSIRAVLSASYAPADASRAIGRESVLGVAAVVLLFAGLGWRLAVVPFHFGLAELWGRDWRSGLLAATIGRAAAFVVLIRLVVSTLVGFEEPARLVASLLAGLTFIVAGVRALSRVDIRVTLADLVVLHGGFLLMGVAAALAAPGAAESGAAPGPLPEAIAAALAVLAISSVAAIGAVSVLLWLGGRRSTPQTTDDLSGLARTSPLAAACLGLMLLALAGVPPVIGFWTRWSLVLATLTAPAEASAAGTIGLDTGFVVLTWSAAAGTLFAAIASLRLLEPMLLVGPLGRPASNARYSAVSALLATLTVAAATLMPGRTISLFDSIQPARAAPAANRNATSGYNQPATRNVPVNQSDRCAALGAQHASRSFSRRTLSGRRA